MRKTVKLDDRLYLVPMDIVRSLIPSPFEACPWDCDLFTINDVLAVPEGQECAVPYDHDVMDMVVGQDSYHTARIAYMLRFPEEFDGDDYESMPTFSVANSMFGHHPLQDGNHRYAAAIINGDEFFPLFVSDDVDEAEYLFGMESAHV